MTDAHISIEDRVFERVESVGVENLTEAEKNYWLIWLVESEANNGGLEQFFDACKEYAEDTVTALEEIGANKTSCLLKRAITEVDNNGNFEGNDSLRELSNKFTDYPDDLGALINNYVEKNISNYLGPVTELELWEQRKSRGANTRPSVVTRVVDFDEEAKIDEKYSSRSCPECLQPIPDYRKSCKKCGYPIGRI